MADDPKPATDAKTARLIRTQAFRTVYSNTFRFRSGAQELSTTFGYQTELPPNQIVLQDEVEVVVTPLTFKFQFLAMQLVMESIEKVNGPIELPPEMQEALRNMAEQHAQNVEATLAAKKAAEAASTTTNKKGNRKIKTPE